MIDLSTALHDAARSGTARRPALAADPVLSRIRRRRTARVAVESTVGVAAAGAVALGAVQLAGLRTTPESPTPSAMVNPLPPDTAALAECGLPIQDPNPGADPTLGLSGTISSETIAARDELQVTVELVNGSDQAFVLEDPDRPTRSEPPVLVAVQDGVVVSQITDGLTGNLQPEIPAGGSHSYWFNGTLDPCDGGADTAGELPAGDYEMYAFQRLAVDSGTGTPALTLLGGPWRFTVVENGEEVEPTNEPEADTPPTLDSLVIGFDGLGQLAIGSTVPTDPAPTDLLRWDAEFCTGTEVPGRWLANYDDVVDADGERWQPFSVSTFEDHVIRINVQVAGPHTAEGIEVGSTLAELQSAYPALEKLRSAVDTGIPIDAWGLRDGETTLVFEIAANADTPEPYWQSADLDRVVAIVLVNGVPYGSESWFSELCG